MKCNIRNILNSSNEIKDTKRRVDNIAVSLSWDYKSRLS